jgi:hypothetical protein
MRACEGVLVATIRFEARPTEETWDRLVREVIPVVRVARRVDCVRADRVRTARARVDRVTDERVAAESVVAVAGRIESSAAIGDGVSVGCEMVSRFADITSRASVLSSASTSPIGFGSSEHAVRDTVAVNVKAIARRAVFIRGRPAMGSP